MLSILLLVLGILTIMYVPFWVLCFIVLFCVLLYVLVNVYCTVLLPQSVNSIAVNKYII